MLTSHPEVLREQHRPNDGDNSLDSSRATASEKMIGEVHELQSAMVSLIGGKLKAPTFEPAESSKSEAALFLPKLMLVDGPSEEAKLGADQLINRAGHNPENRPVG